MIGDVLKKFRGSGYAGRGESVPKQETPAAPDDSQEESPRVIALLDDELKSFQGVKPGEDLTCEVHGNISEDGEFRVMSVAPLEAKKGYGSEQEMAGQVAQRVTPTVQLSPS